MYDVLREREGWYEVAEEDEDDPDSWDFFWADTSWVHEHLSNKTKLAPHQRVNHFPSHYELTRKDLLVKNLKRAKRALEREGQLARMPARDRTDAMIEEARMYTRGVWPWSPEDDE